MVVKETQKKNLYKLMRCYENTKKRVRETDKNDLRVGT